MSAIRDDLLTLRRLVDSMLEKCDAGGRSRSNAAVDNQRFSYGDPAHRMKAEAIFDELEISENRRSWFYNKTLEGVPLGELRELIHREDAKFRQRWSGDRRRHR